MLQPREVVSEKLMVKLVEIPYEFHPRNPARPPDWRWQLAGALNAQLTAVAPKEQDPAAPCVPRSARDAYVRHARIFRRLSDKSTTDEEQFRLCLQDEDTYHAYRLFRDNGSAQRALRAELEAWLLTELDDEAIAGRSGLSLRTVQVYEAWYFSVRTSPINDFYLTHVILQSAARHGATGRAPELLWKAVAYRGGAEALHYMIHGCRRQEACGEEFFHLHVRRRMVTLAYEATSQLRPDVTTYHTILDAYHRLCEREQASGPGASDSLAKHIMEVNEPNPSRNCADLFQPTRCARRDVRLR